MVTFSLLQATHCFEDMQLRMELFQSQFQKVNVQQCPDARNKIAICLSAVYWHVKVFLASSSTGDLMMLCAAVLFWLFNWTALWSTAHILKIAPVHESGGDSVYSFRSSFSRNISSEWTMQLKAANLNDQPPWTKICGLQKSIWRHLIPSKPQLNARHKLNVKLKKYFWKSRAAEGAQFCVLLSFQKKVDLGCVKCVKAESKKKKIYIIF